MEQITPSLYVTDPHDLGFGESPLYARTYLLQRPAGNLLIYGADAVLPHLDQVEELDGAARQYLNHSHEASAAAAEVRERLGAPLFVHQADAAETEELVSVDQSFSQRHIFEDDFEAIPIPGHSAGATAYLWHGPEARVLFTGDSVFLTGDLWRAAFLDAFSVRDDYVASMEVLADLEFDLLAPGVAHKDRPPTAQTSPKDSRRRLLEIAERLRAGRDR